MPLNDLITFDEMHKRVASDCRNALAMRDNELRQYLEWQNFLGGRSFAEVASYFMERGLTATYSDAQLYVAQIDAAYAGFKTDHDFITNATSFGQGDLSYSWMQIS